MSKGSKYIIYCRQFANSHDDFIYTGEDLESAKILFKTAINKYHEYLRNLGLHIKDMVYEGPRTEKEFEECLPLVTFITDDHLMFEVEMVESRKFQSS